MTKKILVTYASRAGATAEIAEAIGQILGEGGAAVDVYPVKEVTDLSPYRAVILGSAIYMGGWMLDATRFIEKYRVALHQIPLATFTVSLLMVERPIEHQQLMTTYFTGSGKQPQLWPINNGLFAGRLDYGRLSLFYRTIAKMMKAKEEDKRDWPAIQAWAGELVPQFV